jgi:outer membrane protein OmpA-like peptidoglycan-associated protein
MGIVCLLVVLTPFDIFAVEDDWVIPADAQEKAVQALAVLGPSRGAIPIAYRMVAIRGISGPLLKEGKDLEDALKILGVEETDTEFRVNLSGDIFFGFDSIDIAPEAETILAHLAEVIRASGSPKIIVAGHTDSVGGSEYNRNLSLKRAQAVKTWLRDHQDIDVTAITTIGHGETRPVAPNTRPDGSDDPEGRRRNRRVEIIIKKQGSRK